MAVSLLDLPTIPANRTRGRFVGQPPEPEPPDLRAILPEIRAMRAEGKTLQAIGEKFGVSKQTIFRILNKP